jgi:hypothetical protein
MSYMRLISWIRPRSSKTLCVDPITNTHHLLSGAASTGYWVRRQSLVQ